MLEPRHMSERREEPVRGRRPVPEVSASVRDAAGTFSAEPPTAEDIAGTQGAQVILPPDSAASAGAKGVYPTIEQNTLLRDAGYMQMGLDPQDPSNELTDPDTPPAPPEGGNGGAAAEAPVNTAVPAASQEGAALTVTMGVWEGEPTSYTYEWTVGGNIHPASDVASYAVQPADVGTTATCIVTASNAAGSTAAPPSNGVVIV